MGRMVAPARSSRSVTRRRYFKPKPNPEPTPKPKPKPKPKLKPNPNQAEDRALAGPTAPAAGLCLEHVEYEAEWAASHWDK